MYGCTAGTLLAVSCSDAATECHRLLQLSRFTIAYRSSNEMRLSMDKAVVHQCSAVRIRRVNRFTIARSTASSNEMRLSMDKAVVHQCSAVPRWE